MKKSVYFKNNLESDFEPDYELSFTPFENMESNDTCEVGSITVEITEEKKLFVIKDSEDSYIYGNYLLNTTEESLNNIIEVVQTTNCYDSNTLVEMLKFIFGDNIEIEAISIDF